VLIVIVVFVARSVDAQLQPKVAVAFDVDNTAALFGNIAAAVIGSDQLIHFLIDFGN
jgi:hypothetical protein